MDKYNWRLGSTTTTLGKPPLFYTNRDLLPSGCQFASVYGITAEDAQAIHTEGTAAQFKGVVWSARLWADFDTTESAEAAKAFLKKEGYDHVVYTTGNRGAHIGVARSATPSHLLPQRDKQWAATNLPGCDLSLYWHLHLIRLPGAVHESTGLRKELLYSHEGRQIILPPYVNSEGTSYVPKAPTSSGNRDSIFNIWSIASNLTEPTGISRHKHLVGLAKALRDDGQVTADEALWVLLEVNRGYGEAKPEEEVQSILRWAYGT